MNTQEQAIDTVEEITSQLCDDISGAINQLADRVPEEHLSQSMFALLIRVQALVEGVYNTTIADQKPGASWHEIVEAFRAEHPEVFVMDIGVEVH